MYQFHSKIETHSSEIYRVVSGKDFSSKTPYNVIFSLAHMDSLQMTDENEKCLTINHKDYETNCMFNFEQLPRTQKYVFYLKNPSN